MKSALRPHHQLIIIALILLIHGGMLMTFIIIEFQSDSLEMPKHEALVTIQEESPQMDRDWVAMSNPLSASQFVAQETPPEHAEQPSEIQEAQAVQSAEQQSDEQKQQSEIAQAEQNIDDAIALASEILALKQAEKQENSEPKDRTPAKQPTKSASGQQSVPTLAQLTQGFVEHLQQADMAVKSNRGGVASIEQMKHLNYCQKIIGCIVNAYKITNHTAPNKSMLARRARVQMALNRNGTIAHLALQESSGDSTVDKFLLDMFKDASSSFPPVPAGLTDSPYQLPSFSVDSLESFRSTQGWHIDNTSI